MRSKDGAQLIMRSYVIPSSFLCGGIPLPCCYGLCVFLLTLSLVCVGNRHVLGGPQPGLLSGRHQGSLQHGDRRDLHRPRQVHRAHEELVPEQEHQGEEARVVQRVHDRWIPGKLATGTRRTFNNSNG